MGQLKMKLRAATLIESLIAMIIIVVCLGSGTMIYSNVLSSDKQRVKFKAILLLNREAEQIKKDKFFIDGEQEAGEYIIRRVVKKFPGAENVYSLRMAMLNKEGKIMGTRNELIVIE